MHGGCSWNLGGSVYMLHGQQLLLRVTNLTVLEHVLEQ